MNTIAKCLSVSLLFLTVAFGPALGQVAAGPLTAPAFSIDFQGPTIGLPDGTGGMPITAGDILVPTVPPGPGPLPTPSIAIPAIPGLGIIPGQFGPVELDALSFGRDEPWGEIIYFSVDEFAVGAPGAVPPDVSTEGANGNMEASADVFRAPSSLGWHSAALDGDGLAPSGLAGLGLIEPNPPIMASPDAAGDNLDALDMNAIVFYEQGPVYFSLDSSFPDPFESTGFGPPANTATALSNGFVGGDVLMSFPGAGPIVYASAAQLGLDLFGPDTDDLDALALWDDGDGIYEPLVDWLAFSVRRGSAIIGTLDATQGLPIEEGDILMSPLAVGAPAGSAPHIALRADVELGLATARSGLVQIGDDLNALDVVPEPATMLVLLAGLALASLRGFRRA